MGSDTRRTLAKIEQQLDDYAEIKAIWQKHGMPLRSGDMAMSLNEVLLHYKGFVAAEKEAKDAAFRGRFDACAAEAKRDEQLNLLRGVPGGRRTATEQAALDKQYQGRGKDGMINAALASEPGPLHAWGVAEKKVELEECAAEVKREVEGAFRRTSEAKLDQPYRVDKDGLIWAPEKKACSHTAIHYDGTVGWWICEDCECRMIPPDVAT